MAEFGSKLGRARPPHPPSGHSTHRDGAAPSREARPPPVPRGSSEAPLEAATRARAASGEAARVAGSGFSPPTAGARAAGGGAPRCARNGGAMPRSSGHRAHWGGGVRWPSESRAPVALDSVQPPQLGRSWGRPEVRVAGIGRSLSFRKEWARPWPSELGEELGCALRARC